MAKGFTQREGVDYNEIYSSVVRHASIIFLLVMVVQHGMILEQLDVKTSFLRGSLEEKIFMTQPEGYVEKGKKQKVCLVKRS